MWETRGVKMEENGKNINLLRAFGFLTCKYPKFLRKSYHWFVSGRIVNKWKYTGYMRSFKTFNFLSHQLFLHVDCPEAFSLLYDAVY